MSGILGDLSVLDLPGAETVTKEVQDGISATVGGNFVSDSVVKKFIVDEVKQKLSTGLCVAKVNGKKKNPLTRWSKKFTVKKYSMGEMKLPM